ncbi:MAG: prevent-host-death protein [Prevotellaceae bacterium]|jgi:hypothetical protein|nr:prevent-host-death protein [Prevotellaceae bacterium]
MLAVSSRDFMQRQSAYFDMLDEGAEIVIKRAKNRQYKVVAVPPNDDTLMTKEEFFAKIERAEEQERRGEYITLKSKEEIKAFFSR